MLWLTASLKSLFYSSFQGGDLSIPQNTWNHNRQSLHDTWESSPLWIRMLTQLFGVSNFILEIMVDGSSPWEISRTRIWYFDHDHWGPLQPVGNPSISLQQSKHIPTIHGTFPLLCQPILLLATFPVVTVVGMLCAVWQGLSRRLLKFCYYTWGETLLYNSIHHSGLPWSSCKSFWCFTWWYQSSWPVFLSDHRRPGIQNWKRLFIVSGLC